MDVITLAHGAQEGGKSKCGLKARLKAGYAYIQGNYFDDSLMS